VTPKKWQKFIDSTEARADKVPLALFRYVPDTQCVIQVDMNTPQHEEGIDCFAQMVRDCVAGSIPNLPPAARVKETRNRGIGSISFNPVILY